MRFHVGEMDKIEKGTQPPSRLHALRRERWTAARHADVAERRGWRARHGRADLGRHGPGMTIIDPRQLREARRASPPSLKPSPSTASASTRAVRRFANGSTVQIEYAALSLSATSKLRFRHLLDGVDADWVYDADGRRATYANLAVRRLSIPCQHHGGRAVDRAVAVGVHRRSAVLPERLVSHRRRHGAGRRDRRGREAARTRSQDPLRAGDRRAHAPEPRDPRHAAPEPGRARSRARGAGDAPRHAKAT